ncbi:mannose-6-phosphate isomerase, class I [Fodinicola acaciae]|uniref:mannose-6-phosphate isomerase, class I n=1 Tax=Fodinicola acaciae TaxID=2681555 RepID=UPI0013D30EAF|nr:mannose-6-phosphate isomerase, class I [Fodinicola acaciae]
MQRLTGPIRPYDWGSHEVIARVQGRDFPTAEPEAELWLGAHPADPATVDGRGLDAVIAGDPDAELGATVVRRFGAKLPFLLKLLAAQRPLSLQVHPNLAQAAAGFEAEEAAGVPVDAPQRRYKDANHKPEMLVAVGRTQALAGFADDATVFLRKLQWPPGLGWADRLEAGDLHGVVSDILRGAPDFDDLADLCAAEGSARALAIADLAARYPGDPGVLVAMLLNHVELSPGDAIYLAAGSPHAYLRGAGVEIMAASDNVLRGGLTSKFVDVDELLRILAFEPGPPPVVTPVSAGPSTVRWPTPTAEFTLYEITVGGSPVALPAVGSPRVLFCLEGEVRAADLSLRGGESAWSPASDPELTARGTGRLFVATVGG